MKTQLKSIYQCIFGALVVITLFLAALIVLGVFHPAFAQYGQLSPDAQLALAEEQARIEWIERNGDVPTAPTQADLEYMQQYIENIQTGRNDE